MPKPNIRKIEADAIFHATMTCLPAMTQAYRYFQAQGKTEQDFDRCAREAMTKAVRNAVELTAREVADPVWPYALDSTPGVTSAVPPGCEKMRGGKPVSYWRDNALEAAALIAEAYQANPGVAADIRAMKSGSNAGVTAAPAPEPCSRGTDKPDPTCTNRQQCWEPCGELGKSAERARRGHTDPAEVDRLLGIDQGKGAATDLLRRLVEWNDRGDCRSLRDFVEEARRLLAASGVPASDSAMHRPSRNHSVQPTGAGGHGSC